MSLEICKLCEQDSTPWFHINGHICDNCYYNAKEKSEWINVKEKLPDRQPEGYQTYIVALWSHTRNIYHVGTYDWRDNFFKDCYGEKLSFDDGYWEVTHWMLLPKPPNG